MRMPKSKDNNYKALIVAYYLSRLDKQSYLNLGYKSFNEAFREIGLLLNVKASTIKNMRDEFDYFMPNDRAGWSRTNGLKGTRSQVFQMFSAINENNLLEVVKDILENEGCVDAYNFRVILNALEVTNKKRICTTRDSVPRALTGRKAEEYYKSLYDRSPLPTAGELVDTREQGCGYDFMIQKPDANRIYIEVKGLQTDSGGILFTNKEWRTAKVHKDSYYLAIVTNIYYNPKMRLIKNPASVLKPKRRIITTISTNWSVNI